MDDYQMLLPTLIDEIARSDPHRLYCALVKSTSIEDGVVEVTYDDYANAVNRCAQWLEDTLGKGTHYNVLAYVGPTDIRYSLITLAAVKTGHTAMLVSPANSTEAQVKLLEAVNCNCILTAEDFPAIKPALSAIAAKRDVQIVPVSSVDHWLASERVPLYPFRATLDDDPQRPFVVLHTSGSTGLPEPITYTFGALTALHRYTAPKDTLPDPSPTVVDEWRNTRQYLPFPSFHMVGLLCSTALAVYWQMPPIIGPPNVLPTAELASNIIKLDIVQSAVVSPAVLEQMYRSPEQLEGLRKLKHLLWCGAPFSRPSIPEKLREYTKIFAAYGSTEIGPLPLTVVEQEYHEWMKFNRMSGAELRHYSEDLYELVIVKDPKIKATQFVFFNFPHLSEWPTKDLMSKHPTEDLWRYRGRRDDIIIMSNGLNIQPLPLEGIVMSHPKVVSALLTGSGHTKVVWLIEVRDPPSSEDEKAQLIDDLWPVIQQASDVGPAQARVSKDAVVFTTKEKPMLRAGKGSVQRRLTVQAYQEELNAFY